MANNAPPAPIRSGLERPQIPQRSPKTSALVERLPAKNTNIKLDKTKKVGHNKGAATDKPRTRWETGQQ